jgi:HD-GYP domain-containing protein (c-di-GMP phosphodiesterase class II)
MDLSSPPRRRPAAAHERRARFRRREDVLTSVRALVAAVHARDERTGEHSRAVVPLANGVARRLGLAPDEAATVQHVALLHDVGKIGIPDGVLLKPGPLSEREWSTMRRHPVIGERIVRGIEPLEHLARAIRAEHERWDGRGYPDGLAGHAIPLASRIVLACDAFHAMTSDRPYRAALPSGAALAELAGGAGTQFDPLVVDALIAEISSVPD